VFPKIRKTHGNKKELCLEVDFLLLVLCTAIWLVYQSLGIGITLFMISDEPVLLHNTIKKGFNTFIIPYLIHSIVMIIIVWYLLSNHQVPRQHENNHQGPRRYNSRLS